ncbi:MAG: hypothetical protein E6I77_00610 [Chloroflexi bacterium]|nr:MAG: hypothetical protein E6I77_00610 [Chloroflexota bacterium]
MPASRLAVDMSSETLRVVEGLPGGPMRCGEAGAPPGSMQGSRVLDPAALGQALRQLVARSEIMTSRAVVAAGDAVASFRVMSFPRSATDADIDAAVRNQLDLGTSKMARRHLEVPGAAPEERAVFAAVWDRAQVVAIAESIRLAGLNAETDRDLARSIFDALRPVLGLSRRSGGAGFGPSSPIVVRADPPLVSGVATRLEELTGRGVLAVDPPPRVDPAVRYVPYLTCLGLILRRSG